MGTDNERTERAQRATLLRGWRIELLKFFRRKVAPEDVEDLTQQAWAVMAGVDPARIQTTVRAYLRGVARHVLYNHFRASRRCGEFDPQVDLLTALVATGTQRIAAQWVERRLQELPVDLQLLFEGHVEGLTGPELATAFGVPEGTVRSRLARVRRALGGSTR